MTVCLCGFTKLAQNNSIITIYMYHETGESANYS